MTTTQPTDPREVPSLCDKPWTEMKPSERIALFQLARRTLAAESALESAEREIADLKSRVAQLVAEGFDVQRVLEWQQSNPRKPAIHAFTAGPERQAAYLIEGERRVAEREWGDAQRELQSAYQQLAYLWNRTGSCPCGARLESPNTHSHVAACPTGFAVEADEDFGKWLKERAAKLGAR